MTDHCFEDQPEDGFDGQDRTADRLDVLHRIVNTLEKVPVDDPRRVWRIGDALRLCDTIPRHRAELAHLRARLMRIR